jgi:hypothetical protein
MPCWHWLEFSCLLVTEARPGPLSFFSTPAVFATPADDRTRKALEAAR